MVLDVGHSTRQPGATSATGRPEFLFNRYLAATIEARLRSSGFSPIVLITESGNLPARTERSNRLHPDLFLSVHHDSVQSKYLRVWRVGGQEQFYSDQFHGWSIFVSRDGAQFERSLVYAKLLSDGLRARGLPFSIHHAEPIPHENRPLVDAKRGVYAFDQLIVLRQNHAPAVLIEAGVIVNRDEEIRAASPERQALIADAVVEAAQKFCETGPFEASGKNTNN